MSCFTLFFKRSRTTQQQSDPSNEDLSGAENITRYSYKELAKATSNFDQSNKIGEGGFGPVYKGTLKDGTDVAVKLLSLQSRQGVNEFLNELIAISGVSHENLVKLHGCCVEGTHRILVYNYLENNSLAHTLLGSRQSNIQFNWRTRILMTTWVLPLQTWKYYDQGHLDKIIDSSLGDDLDVDEACRFLTVGLLCTQDITKRRPTMSMVISMLTGEMEVDKEKISKPDVIRDFRDLKLRSKATSTSTLLTSIMAHSSASSSQETTRTSITFTAISNRDCD
ncbi:hypothetical protein ABZP36_021524 [Zizania latifolia]